MTDEEFWTLAREQADAPPVSPHPEEYLECSLRRGRCFVPLTALYEVVAPPFHFAMLPATPPWMPGLVSWRNEVIPVACLDTYLFGGRVPSDIIIGDMLNTPGTMMLIADCGALSEPCDQPFALIVAVIGSITAIDCAHATPLGEELELPGPGRAALKCLWDDAYVLDTQTLLADMLKQVAGAAHG